MRWVTFAERAGEAARVGAMLGDSIVDLVAADAIVPGRAAPLAANMRGLLAQGAAGKMRVAAILDFAKGNPSALAAAIRPAAAVRLLPPVPDAEKFLCVGKNYRTHLEELRKNDLLLETPQEPTAFVKYNYCLVGHDAEVVRPDGIVRLDYEPELVFVIGKRALGVKREQAFDYVAGVTVLNDLTCRDLQKREVASGSRFWTGKNIPGFGPLGPSIVTLDEIPDPYDLWMICKVNGELRMRVNTGDQIWKLPDILEHFTRYIPFEPGDMFSTGAPGGVAVGKPNAEAYFLKPGDVVECGIEGFITLSTRIVAPR